MPRSWAVALAPGHSSETETVQYFVVAMCIAGGLIPAITLAVEPTDTGTAIGFAILAAAMALTALVVWFVRPPRQRMLELVAQWGTLLIGGNIVLMPTVGIMPVYLLWPVVLIAYFSSIRVLVMTYLWSMTVLTVATVLNPPAFGFVDVLIGMGSTLAIMAGVVWVVTQRQRALRQELEIAARTDPLTGLLNRRAFLPWLQDAIDEVDEHGGPFSVVMLDLDHFKSINDGLGHLGGDRVLVAVAAALRAQSRAEDVLCRFGGEEFAVGLPGASVEEAKAYAGRVATALAAAGVVEGRTLTASVGIAVLSAGTSVEDLLRSADDAMYAAKRGGRNQVAVWDRELSVGPDGDEKD